MRQVFSGACFAGFFTSICITLIPSFFFPCIPSFIHLFSFLHFCLLLLARSSFCTGRHGQVHFGQQPGHVQVLAGSSLCRCKFRQRSSSRLFCFAVCLEIVSFAQSMTCFSSLLVHCHRCHLFLHGGGLLFIGKGVRYCHRWLQGCR